MSRFLFDLRLALRNLRRSPLFAIVAISSLALGIGANTAIFTLIDQLLLRLLPVRDPEQLVLIYHSGPHLGSNRGFRMSSYPMYQDYSKKAEAFSYVFCRFETDASLSFGGQTERVSTELVSGNFFQALGVGPALGRVFNPEDDDRVYKGHPSIVLTHAYWVTRFASDPSVIGKKVLVDNYPYTIIGVSAPGFGGLDPSRAPQIRIPIQMKPLMTPGWDSIGDRRSQWINMFARMKPGFTIEKATASLQPLFTQILNEEIARPELRDTTQYNRDRFLKRRVVIESAANGFSFLRRSYSTALIVLMCMVGLVLLIACFNVANLLVARALARQKEVAVRLAVGASRGQILRQLLIESLTLSLAGGLAGVFLAMAIIRGLLSFLPSGGSPLLLSATPDFRILAFNGMLAFLTGLLFGLAPAMQSMRFNLWNMLKDVVGAVSGGGGAVRFRKVLVMAQVAFSFLLLAGAGLFVRTLENLQKMDSGFRGMENLVSFQLDPALNGYDVPRIKAFYTQLLDSVRGLPGVQSAAYNAVPVLHGTEWDSSMSVEGHQAKDGEDMQAFMNAISPEYWKTMGVKVIEGRDFDARDTGTKTTVAIVNRKFATHFFGEKSAIGRHIGWGGGPKTKLDMEIIGVTEDTLYEGPREGVRRQVFLCLGQSNYPSAATFYLRSAGDSKAMFASLRQRVRELDAAMPVYEMKTLQVQLDETLGTERLIATLSAAFGVLATLLASLGLYGVMAFVVARRTKEIGLRMALGAQQGAVLWMVMREALILLGIGLAIGIPAAYGLSRYVSTQLFGVKPTDIASAAIALVILAVVAVLSGWLPARRASTIDPIQALRYE